MAHESNRLPGVVERFEQCDRHGAFGQIPQGTMPANVEHRVKFIRFDISELYCLRKLLLCPCVLLETGHRICLIFGHVALWIDRRLPSIRRSQSQLDAGVSEHEIRRGELLQPET